MPGFEPGTSSLPRMCSTPELHGPAQTLAPASFFLQIKKECRGPAAHPNLLLSLNKRAVYQPHTKLERVMGIEPT
jgi:hypothetical protein